MRSLSFSIRLFGIQSLFLGLLLALVGFTTLPLVGQTSSAQATTPAAPAPAKDQPSAVSVAAPGVVEALIGLRVTSTITLSSEITGAFTPPVKCDVDGNLYIRKFAFNRPLGPVVKIDPDGKPTGLFDPAVFGGLGLSRVDAFTPAPDGGIYQVAQTRPAAQSGAKPRVYVLHYSSDGSPASPSGLDADFEVYTFAAFTDGSFLVSGTQRDPMDKNDHGRGVTAVFSSDGRELAQVSFQEPKKKAAKTVDSAAKSVAESGAKSGAASEQAQKDSASVASVPVETPAAPAKSGVALDLKDAEVSRDGNLYVMRTSSQALVDIIAPSGKIMKTLKIATPLAGATPNSFHVSENRLAVLFMSNDEKTFAIDVVDGQTGRRIAAYSGSNDLGSFGCYSANDGVFTFLKHGDGNVIQVIRAEQ
jgi:hypothetical protein